MEKTIKLKNTKVAFALAEIYTDKFEIYSFSDIPEDAELLHDFDLSFGWASEVNFLVVKAWSWIRYKGQPIAEVAISCAFKFGNPDIFLKDNKVIIPVKLGLHLALITHSTSIGVLHAKTEHTPANNFILPLTNIQNILTEDIVLEIDPKFNQG